MKIKVCLFICIVIIALLFLAISNNTLESFDNQNCTPAGGDPYYHGHGQKYKLDCCPGTTMKLDNWDNDGKYYYKCIAAAPNCIHGGNVSGKCVCDPGWTGELCDKYAPGPPGPTGPPGPSPSSLKFCMTNDGSQPLQAVDHGGNWSYGIKYDTKKCIPYGCGVNWDKSDNMQAIADFYGTSKQCTLLFDDNNYGTSDNTGNVIRSGWQAVVATDPSGVGMTLDDIDKGIQKLKDNGCTAPGQKSVCVFDYDGTLGANCHSGKATHNGQYYSEAVNRCLSLPGNRVAINTARSVTNNSGTYTCTSDQVNDRHVITKLQQCINNSVPGSSGGGGGGGKKAVIVIRHGQKDDHNWKPAGSKTLSDGTVIPLNQMSLNSDGYRAANDYAYVLPKLMEKLGLAPITKAIIVNPDGSANSFLTIYPFLKKWNFGKNQVELWDHPTHGSMDPSSNNGSIIVAGDETFLWGGSHNNRPPHAASNSALGILNSMYDINNDNVPSPERGISIYVYIDKDKMALYSLDANNNPVDASASQQRIFS